MATIASTAIMNPYTGAVAAKISCLKIDATGIARASHISASGITLSDVMYMAPRITPPK